MSVAVVVKRDNSLLLVAIAVLVPGMVAICSCTDKIGARGETRAIAGMSTSLQGQSPSLGYISSTNSQEHRTHDGT